uniref:Serine protease 7 n=1 Tax=Costelytra zealandica TaxID=50579 RepID=B0ZBN5_9SCAR|nr:serine protease 7 [Costelytra zealandica]
MYKVAVLLALVAITNAFPRIPTVDSRIGINDNWRVVGGSDAGIGQYPFIVSLRSSANSHFCGATIINTGNLLTAAHCIVSRSTANTFVVAGTNTLNSGGITYSTSRLMVHGNYNSDTFANDVAVIKLASPLSLSSTVARVGLNTATTGAVASIIIGWGRTTANGATPNNLQHLNANTITHAQCQTSWGSSVTDSQICTLSTVGKGACNGDSGGPLVRNDNKAQLGIVSLGFSCAEGFPDVFTRVSSYITWINGAVAS